MCRLTGVPDYDKRKIRQTETLINEGRACAHTSLSISLHSCCFLRHCFYSQNRRNEENSMRGNSWFQSIVIMGNVGKERHYVIVHMKNLTLALAISAPMVRTSLLRLYISSLQT